MSDPDTWFLEVDYGLSELCGVAPMMQQKGLFSSAAVGAVHEALTWKEGAQLRGRDIIDIIPSMKFVPSSSRSGWYCVRGVSGVWLCSCPHNTIRMARCKHIIAVEQQFGKPETVPVSPKPLSDYIEGAS